MKRKIVLELACALVATGCATGSTQQSQRPFEPESRWAVDDDDHVSRLLPSAVENIVVMYPSRLATAPIAVEMSGALNQAGSLVDDVDRVLSVCDLELEQLDRVVLGLAGEEDWIVVADYRDFVREDGPLVHDRLSCMAAALRVLSAGKLDPKLGDQELHVSPGTREELEWMPSYGVLRLLPRDRLVLSAEAIDEDVERVLMTEGAPHAARDLFAAVDSRSSACLHVNLSRLPSDAELAIESFAGTIECSERDEYPLSFRLDLDPDQSARHIAAKIDASWSELIGGIHRALGLSGGWAQMSVQSDASSLHGHTTISGQVMRALLALALMG